MKLRLVNALSLTVLAVVVACSYSVAALAQGQTEVKTGKLNYEVQLHLLVASSEAGEKGNIPQSLEPVVRQLKPLLPFPNYHLAATFVNRVQDGGNLQFSGIGAADLFVAGPRSLSYPTHYEFTLERVKLDTSDASQPMIEIATLRFGLQVPIVTGTSNGDSNSQPFPVINYQPAGITTRISLREGSPTVVGTLNTNRPDQTLILVISVKRTL